MDDTQTTVTGQGLYAVLVSVHGLIRGEHLELGRDADTGGQTKYVVELARALAQRPEMGRVDLLTRLVRDADISPDYAEPEEPLGEGVQIIRLPAGPDVYIRKEQLWDYLDSLADHALEHFRRIDRRPDFIHSHYADAGYVGVRLAHQLAVPLIHTGHSLGRVKRRRLLASGLKSRVIEERYNMARRIEAEEDALGTAELVIASTRNEIDEQYELYDHYQPEQMQVIPPGTDLERFQPSDGSESNAPMARELARFLKTPTKPLILALSRPDERKNITTLIEAYGETPALRETANLVIVAGNRDDIRELDEGAQSVLTEVLLVVDRYDLYGKVAYPKHHTADEVPVLYRLAAASGGIFINPALTEPFGLTLIEAAASGLPIVATEDGGPQDIIGNCRNGYLVDPLDKETIAAAIGKLLADKQDWQRKAEAGLLGVREHYSWTAHAQRYLQHVRPLLEPRKKPPRAPLGRRPMLYHDRAIFSDLDQTLLGDADYLAEFLKVVRANRRCATFGIATGRGLASALRAMRRHHIPQPDVLITSLGTDIHYAPRLTSDTAWSAHIDHLWNPKAVRRILGELPGLTLQKKDQQSRFKLSYFIDPEHAPPLEEINSLLHQHEQTVNTFVSFGQFLDVLPVRGSKGLALRYFADQWGIPLEHVLAAGGSGADEDMMRGNTLAVVVANRHLEELSQLADLERIYFANNPYAAGILEAIDHYDFFRECTVPTA
ncbi:MAG: HAD family hydrolase [Gammaproteobacteria bacterium]|nr:HAD family hydrolase [Gammaproteobacteria bacterium]